MKSQSLAAQVSEGEEHGVREEGDLQQRNSRDGGSADVRKDSAAVGAHQCVPLGRNCEEVVSQGLRKAAGIADTVTQGEVSFSLGS